MSKYDTELKDFGTLFSLKGRIAVVTGGSRGLGLSAASAYLQAGCKTVYITSRDATACTDAINMLNSLPNLPPDAKAISIPADSSTIEGITHLVSEVSKTTDRIDILFANAGAYYAGDFDTHPDEEFAKVMDLNVKSVFGTVRLFAPLLQKAATPEDPSRVIVTASISGLAVAPSSISSQIGYSASKAAAIHLTRNLAIELGPRHILCNSISPGFFPSKLAEDLMERCGGVQKLAEVNPHRRLGRPEDIAGAVIYLSSRAGSHVNGVNLVLDGGEVLNRA